jgi:hypothetical protein
LLPEIQEAYHCAGRRRAIPPGAELALEAAAELRRLVGEVDDDAAVLGSTITYMSSHRLKESWVLVRANEGEALALALDDFVGVHVGLYPESKRLQK